MENMYIKWTWTHWYPLTSIMRARKWSYYCWCLYYPGFNLMGCGSWFSTRIWISTTEFVVITNLFMTSFLFKEKYHLIYIFKITFMSQEYTTNNNYVWTLYTLKYVDFFLLSSTNTFPIVSNWALSNLKNLNLKFPKNVIISSLIYSHLKQEDFLIQLIYFSL